MKILIISLPRTGSTSLMKLTAKKHNLNNDNYYLITALDGTKAIKKKLKNNRINKIITAF